MAARALRVLAGSPQSDPTPSALRAPDPLSPENCCNASAYESRLNLRRAVHPRVRVAMDKFQILQDSATVCARKSQCAHPGALLLPSEAAMRSDSPVPAKSVT